jgi:F0F1-type ATP synthase membrane subunit b/b'
METFVAIFTQLGVDSSLPFQFIILVLAFISANFLFLGKLQRVLEVREERTVKLESAADDTIEKVNQMQSEYKSKIDEASHLAMKKAAEKKNLLSQKFHGQYKVIEKEINNEVDQSRAQFGHEVKMSKEKLLAESETLADSLVKKIIQ